MEMFRWLIISSIFLTVLFASPRGPLQKEIYGCVSNDRKICNVQVNYLSTHYTAEYLCNNRIKDGKLFNPTVRENTISIQHYMWIGLKRVAGSTQWKWSNGVNYIESDTNTYWPKLNRTYTTLPAVQDQCVAVYTRNTFQVFNCNHTLYGFFCLRNFSLVCQMWNVTDKCYWNGNGKCMQKTTQYYTNPDENDPCKVQEIKDYNHACKNYCNDCFWSSWVPSTCKEVKGGCKWVPVKRTRYGKNPDARSNCIERVENDTLWCMSNNGCEQSFASHRRTTISQRDSKKFKFTPDRPTTISQTDSTKPEHKQTSIDDSAKPDDSKKSSWWGFIIIILGVLVILILVVIAIVVVSRRRRRLKKIDHRLGKNKKYEFNYGRDKGIQVSQKIDKGLDFGAEKRAGRQKSRGTAVDITFKDFWNTLKSNMGMKISTPKISKSSTSGNGMKGSVKQSAFYAKSLKSKRTTKKSTSKSTTKTSASEAKVSKSTGSESMVKKRKQNVTNDAKKVINSSIKVAKGSRNVDK